MLAHTMQNGSSDCGIAVLSTIFKQYHLKIPQNFLSPASLDNLGAGLSLNDLKVTLEEYGIKSDIFYLKDVCLLDQLNLPFIALVEEAGMNHYVVVQKIDETNITLSNPTKSNLIQLSVEQFSDIFLNYVISTDYTGLKISKTHKNEHISKSSIQKEIKQLITFHDLLAIFSIRFMKILILINFVINTSDNKLDNTINAKITNQLLTSFISKNISNINNKENVNTMMGYFWNLIVSINGLISRYYLITDTVILGATLITIMFLNKVMFIILALTSIFFILTFNFLSKKLVLQQQNYILNSGNLASSVEETLQSSYDTIVFSRPKNVLRFIKNKLSDYLLSYKNLSYWDSTSLGVYDVFSNFGYIFCFTYIIFAFNFGSISVISTLITFYLIMIFTSTFKGSVMKWITYSKSKGAIEYLNNSINFIDNIQIETALPDYTEPINELSTIGLTFSYDEQHTFKWPQKLTFKSGNIIALLGDNGIGKSTLTKILMGVNIPSQGTISVNGKVLNTAKESIVNRTSVYSSEMLLFFNSISQNITLNFINPKTSSKFTNSTNFLLDNLAVDKVLQSNGINVSQGERQRILLARALHKDADIYIFDEPTTNLDINKKNYLINVLKKLKEKNKIVILVTHDPQLAKISDTTYRLENQNET